MYLTILSFFSFSV